MTDVDLSAADLARMLYHMDNSLTEKADYTKWKERYETLIKNLKLSGLKVDKEYTEKHENDMETKDEKLRWKIQLIQDATHKEELEDKEDKDYDDDE